MPLILLAIGKWLMSKTFLYVLVGAAAVGLFALWLFASESFESEPRRVGELLQLEERAGEVYGEINDIHGRLVALGSEIEEKRQLYETARRMVEHWDGILARIGRFLTLSSAEKENAEKQLAEERRKKALYQRELDEKLHEQSRLRIDRTSLTIEAKDLEVNIAKLQASSSKFVANLKKSWSQLKLYLLVAVVSVITLPIAFKLFAFYVWAPLLALAGPIRLDRDSLEKPRLQQSGVSAQMTVKSGEKLWVRESFLQASDESLKRKTRFVLNWAIPCTCVAAGLVEMVEFAGEEEEGKVIVSPQKNADLELSVIEIPKGGRLVVRPSSIAGVFTGNGDSVSITRRWRLFHPQAWLSFQFRYFIFEGPCSLVVTGVRGVRFEDLDSTNEKGRRSNQVATVGFTPDLSYGVVRAETFWSYFRGYNPLFDDVFRGKGAFLCQEITDEESLTVTKFWNNFWSGVLKVLGV